MNPLVRHGLMPSVILLLAGAVFHTGEQNTAVQAHEFYPLAPGNKWTYQSSVRGEFVNEVVGHDSRARPPRYTVQSTDRNGRIDTMFVTHDNGRIYQEASRSGRSLLVDFSVEEGASFNADRGRSEVIVTYRNFHPMLTLMGAEYHDVREYRHTINGEFASTSYFAKGIGLVGLVSADGRQATRLLSAEVGGRRILGARR